MICMWYDDHNVLINTTCTGFSTVHQEQRIQEYAIMQAQVTNYQNVQPTIDGVNMVHIQANMFVCAKSTRNENSANREKPWVTFKMF